uniref:UBX domain-containing protein 6 isoform X1 n=1 Tax=Pogona vitticeps TaxID=103695 RepID=A0ABM5EM55_9SAUR
MKKFFQDIKADIQFRTAGPGQKLSESPRESAPKEKPKPGPSKSRQGPTNEAQMAAAAALARLEQKPKARPLSSQDAIRNQVKKELMAEAAASDKGASVEQKSPTAGAEEDPSLLSVSGVYFTCPLTGVIVRKDQRDKQIKEAILQHAARDPVAASIMEIHTFNRDREKVKLGVETIAKYLDNIHLHPEEEKYQKIKLQNKVFQERIHCLEGADKFFEAVGFEKATLSVPGQEGTTEDFYVLKDAALEKLDTLKEQKEKLLKGEPVRARLDRQLSIFKPSPQASRFELPSDFFNLTAEELKREQRLRSGGEGLHAEDQSHAGEGGAARTKEVQLHTPSCPFPRRLHPARDILRSGARLGTFPVRAGDSPERLAALRATGPWWPQAGRRRGGAQRMRAGALCASDLRVGRRGHGGHKSFGRQARGKCPQARPSVVCADSVLKIKKRKRSPAWLGFCSVQPGPLPLHLTGAASVTVCLRLMNTRGGDKKMAF